MSKGNTPTESLFQVRKAGKSKREEQLRDYPMNVDSDEIFFTVPFQSDRKDRSKEGLFTRGMSSHFWDIRDTKEGDFYMSPRHCLLPWMTHRADMRDEDTSWDVWRIRIVDGVKYREFIGTLIGIELAQKSEFEHPNGREKLETIDSRWQGLPVITDQSFLYSKVIKLATIADTKFPDKGKPNAKGVTTPDNQERNNPYVLSTTGCNADLSYNSLT